MSASGRLLLPGDRRHGRGVRVHRAAAALVFGVAWLVVRATVLPELGLGRVPLDPLLPAIVASALAGRRAEAWTLAVGFGLLADFFSGVPSGRSLLQYALVVVLGTPLHGRVVLHDRWVPAVGVGMLALLSGAASLLVLTLMGAARTGDGASLLPSVLGTAAATALFWPFYRRLAGGDEARSMVLRA